MAATTTDASAGQASAPGNEGVRQIVNPGHTDDGRMARAVYLPEISPDNPMPANIRSLDPTQDGMVVYNPDGVGLDGREPTDGSQGTMGTMGWGTRGLLSTLLGLFQQSLARVVIRPTRGSLTDRSGTVTTGGTSQQLAAANTSRNYLMVQNPTAASASFWIRFGTAATTASPSIEVAPGVTLTWEGSFIPIDAVNVNGATAAAFTAKEG